MATANRVTEFKNMANTIIQKSGLKKVISDFFQSTNTKSKSAKSAEHTGSHKSTASSSHKSALTARSKAKKKAASHKSAAKAHGHGKQTHKSHSKHKAHKKTHKPAPLAETKSEVIEPIEESTENPTAAMQGAYDVIPDSDHEVDPAHRPGHQTLELKGEFPEDSGQKSQYQNSKALNYMADSERVFRNTSNQRRINSPSRTASKKGKSLPKSTH